MDKEKLSTTVKEGVEKVIRESAEKYIAKKETVAWTCIDFSSGNGYLMLIRSEGDDTIQVNWTPKWAGFGDMGFEVGYVSTVHFDIDMVVELLCVIITRFMEQ